MKIRFFTFLLLVLGFASGITLAQDSSGSGWTYDAVTKTLTISESHTDKNYKGLDIQNVIIKSNVESIRESAFDGFTSINSVTFEEGARLTRLGNFLFYGCENLKEIEIPESVTEIGDNCFYKSGLTSVTIPKNVVKISNNAFRASENLTSVTFEEGSSLTDIGSYVFPDELRSIVIPSGVKSVGAWFMGGYNVERVEFLGATPPKVTYMGSSDTTRLPIENEDCMIIVPSQDALDAFKKADKWSSYANYYVKGTEPAEGSLLLTHNRAVNIDTLRLPKYVRIGDTFTIYPVEEKYNNLSVLSHSSDFEIIKDESSPYYLPLVVKVIDSGNYGKVNLSVEAYEFMKGGSYLFDPSTKSFLMKYAFYGESTVKILPEVKYTDGNSYEVTRIMDCIPDDDITKNLIVPETITKIDFWAFYSNKGYNWETIEFLGSVPPEVENNDAGLTTATTIIVPSEEAVNKFRENPSFNMCEIVVHGTIVIPTETKVEYKYANDTIKGSIGISFDGKLPASYEKIPENVDSIKVVANPLLGFKLSGDISIIEGGDITKVSNGAYYELKGTGSIVIAATFEKDESVNVDYELEKAPEVDNNEPEVGVNTPTVVASNSDFTVTEGQSVKVISEAVTKETEVNSYINAINEDKGTSISVTNTVIYDITPVIVSSGKVVGKAKVSAGSEGVTLALPYPNNLSASDLESVTVYHFADNGDIEKLTTKKKDNYIEVSGVKSFSPFVLTYTVAEPPVVITYHDLHITESVGAKLVSRNGKDRTPDGGSFTLSLEKEEGYEDCEPTVYYKRGRFGEWKELKLDEVSGYYQIRSVYTDIYVKVSGDGIWPVSNEEVEAQEVKVYTQNGAIVVSTPSLMEVQIISMNGAQVAADKVAGQREFRNLAEGIYVVRVGDKIVKVRL